MATEFHRLVGTSEVDSGEEMEMDVKEEDGDDDEDEEKNSAMPGIVTVDGGIVFSGINRFQQHELMQEQSGNQSGVRRSRPVEEKERTKLRERHRRAITAKILAGLRKHGNYNLRVRADINDVIAALAREAGWVVLPDGTTYPSKSQPRATTSASTTGKTPSSVEYHTSCHLKSAFIPPQSPNDASSNTQSRPSFMVGDGGEKRERHVVTGRSLNALDDKQLGVINMKCELIDPDGLLKQLRVLKSVNVDGVMVDCWWGIVEAHAPQEYNWNGYRRLFQIARELKLRLQVVMSFHECGGNVGDDVFIPQPHWVSEIGRTNPDIFFTDREGRRNSECLSWGADKERVLRGRTAAEVYFDYMRSFRIEFADFFEDGIISMIEIGLGPRGELRYPSFPVKHGWRYPGIGEFQCYDQYLLKSVRKAAAARGQSHWARGPDNAGSYNSHPHETGFFCDKGDYDGYYGRFFLNWYSQVLVDHSDLVLSLAKLVFEDICIAAKISGIYWWYKTGSHAAELTGGFYNPCNRDGYDAATKILRKHGAALNFSCPEACMLDLHAMGDPRALAWQVMNAAWDGGISVTSENAFPCPDREGYNRILERSKPSDDPDGRHLLSFTYLRLCPLLLERQNLMEFERFVKRMHGEVVLDLQS